MSAGKTRRAVLDSEMTSTTDFGQVYEIAIMGTDGKAKSWDLRPYSLLTVMKKKLEKDPHVIERMAASPRRSELKSILERHGVITGRKVDRMKLREPQNISFMDRRMDFSGRPTIGSARKEILDAITSADEIIGYNIKADVDRICYTASLGGYGRQFRAAFRDRTRDLMPEFSHYLGYDGIQFSLQEALTIMGADEVQEHRALSDCAITISLMDAMESPPPSYEQVMKAMGGILEAKEKEKQEWMKSARRSAESAFMAGVCDSFIRRTRRKMEAITASHLGIERPYSDAGYEALYGPRGDGMPMGYPDDVIGACARLKGVTLERAEKEYFRLARIRGWDLTAYMTPYTAEMQELSRTRNTLEVQSILMAEGKDVTTAQVRAAAAMPPVPRYKNGCRKMNIPERTESR